MFFFVSFSNICHLLGACYAPGNPFQGPRQSPQYPHGVIIISAAFIMIAHFTDEATKA